MKGQQHRIAQTQRFVQEIEKARQQLREHEARQHPSLVLRKRQQRFCNFGEQAFESQKVYIENRPELIEIQIAFDRIRKIIYWKDIYQSHEIKKNRIKARQPNFSRRNKMFQ